MLFEVNMRELTGKYDPEALYLVCCEVSKDFLWQANYENCPVLTPTHVNQYKVGMLTKEEFEKKYKSQLRSPTVREYISHLRSLEKSVYLVTNVDYGFLVRNI